ncbi:MULTISPECIES: hypothetical protein [Leptolyngbya]|jgi:hypothetical protein|uniref:hypothetical protein n=1 Tax=Leptolyngbya TaxID=47251 RepID=UPI000361169A|nr:MULTISPECIES: hypothetical protein [Leptolyngbya]MBD2371096.1 hypothetical protein [Leptolyngbya sp. FACHB-161]MBD2377564.1 hypothetical protein [Leptolyngbya sp. FACHB-238]MBD2402017.1 hypothetical protein [Leptolyngbya sp. FACHB-239]MBD2408536.1 hypothetical protein [Leptolyngbya sp. FACHB-402]BAS60436.1 hypothetical protein LBWT_Y0240 [Leptolyngbya boryana IAM M-101]
MTDAFDRLKNRSRATVPLRDASLVKDINDVKTEFSHLSETEVTKVEQSLSELNEVEAFPEVVRRTIRLEQQVDEELERLCSRERLTRETFLEAAYLLCNDKPEILQEVLTIAKERYRQRKAAGEKRKFQTMGKKFES